jgi:hypothetical protein
VSNNETLMLSALRRRYDRVLNLLEELRAFEQYDWAGPRIRRALIESGRLRPNHGHISRKGCPA